MLRYLKHKLVVLALVILPNAYAVVGEESLLLATLCSTTANQLAELTELLETQKQTTEQFTNVANAINEKVDFAERLQYHVDELLHLQAVEIEDLGSLVDESKRLKGRIVDTKEFIQSLEKDVVGEKKRKAANKLERRTNMNKKRMAMRRANLPETSSTKDVQLATAKTNAYMLDEQIGTNNHLIDIKDDLIDMKNREAQKELLRQAEDQRWASYYGMDDYFDSLGKEKAVKVKRMNQ